MGLPKRKTSGYTYADYLNWPDDERWEIIDGVAYSWDGTSSGGKAIINMSPSPSLKHQSISMNLSRIFSTYLIGKKCKVFAAPFDVRLSNMHVSNEDITTIIQPDLSIFCNETKLDEKGAIGAPDLVIEILSENTKNKDLSIKLLLYQKYGVKEYWIIDPASNEIYVYKLGADGKYFTDKIFNSEGEIVVGIFSDLKISLSEIFAA